MLIDAHVAPRDAVPVAVERTGNPLEVPPGVGQSDVDAGRFGRQVVIPSFCRHEQGIPGRVSRARNSRRRTGVLVDPPAEVVGVVGAFGSAVEVDDGALDQAASAARDTPSRVGGGIAGHRALQDGSPEGAMDRAAAIGRHVAEKQRSLDQAAGGQNRPSTQVRRDVVVERATPDAPAAVQVRASLVRRVADERAVLHRAASVQEDAGTPAGRVDEEPAVVDRPAAVTVNRPAIGGASPREDEPGHLGVAVGQIQASRHVGPVDGRHAHRVDAFQRDVLGDHDLRRDFIGARVHQHRVAALSGVDRALNVPGGRLPRREGPDGCSVRADVEGRGAGDGSQGEQTRTECCTERATLQWMTPLPCLPSRRAVAGPDDIRLVTLPEGLPSASLRAGPPFQGTERNDYEA